MACGGGGDDDGDAPDALEQVSLADQMGCHMLPGAIAGGSDTAKGVCMTTASACLVRSIDIGCDNADEVAFQWEAGGYYTVKTFDWVPVTSSHGTVTTMTNADGGILDIPPSTLVTATFMQSVGNTPLSYEIVFRFEDDHVYFESVTEL